MSQGGLVLAALTVIPLLTGCLSGENAPRAPDQPTVIFEPTDVALDFSAGEMVIKGRLIKAPQSRPPIQVWLWAYFINPSEDVEGSRSDEPIFVEPQFAGDTASVVARGPFHWATNQDAPRNGYYAHVRASTRSSDDARVPVPRRNYSPIGAVKVVSGR